ncbi:helix-turn-helix transcriptional regulator [Leifsonia sp. 21MFCrub1.1]|uniref:helix-turn-helix transcriptional regulator n=1 Tax=Leifsonia sp. 21MFCrub1.1 TaxID=1798223 RepID=UPI0008929699|nr:helix-turn-helix transcriptional regulator [Leifsonia sp. 21MFCrub1.1]SEA43811.1 regulatory protein, luxR family [Leifsonia sp. 21MFCrub1.1]
MSLRRAETEIAIAAIGDGISLEIVGGHGSGRTTFLNSLGMQLASRSFHVVSLHGVRPLSSRPLAALNVAGYAARADGRPSGIDTVLAELVDRLPQGSSLITVDDGDYLDEMSWGVLAALHARHRVPIAFTRLARPACSAITSSFGLGEVSTLELRPLRFDELATALESQHGGPLDASTLSQLYARSAGNIGLACAMLESGLREGRIETRNGVITTDQSLWAPSLVQAVERLIDPLTPEQRGLLELLAFVGVLDVETADLLGTSRDLEQLEDLDLVKLLPSGDRQLVSVSPPLVVDYFRHFVRPARRLRLIRTLRQTLDPAGRVVLPPARVQAGESAAQLVHLIHERQETRAVIARSEWDRSRTLRSAIPYIEALSEATRATADIDAAFEESAPLVDAEAPDRAPDDLRAAWHALRAVHDAYNHHKPEEAVRRLRADAATAGAYAGIMLACAVEIELELIGPVDDSGLPDPDGDDEMRSAVRIAIHRARALVALVRGELAASERHLAAIREISGEELDLVCSALVAMILALRSRTTEALALARAGIESSRLRFDAVGMQTFAAIASFCRMADGNYGEVEEILDEMMSLGDSSGRAPLTPFAHLSLTIMSSVTSSRRGRRAVADQRDAELLRMRTPDGPYPTTQRSWAFGQSLASRGEFPEAADEFSRCGDLLWARGARLSAALAYNSALEIDPSTERLARHASRIEPVEGALVQDTFEHVTAVVHSDGPALLANADRFADGGRYGLALASLSAAAKSFAEAGDDASAARARDRHRRLRDTLQPDTFDADRFRTTYVELTARELEVARYAAAGLTNQQIADELVLSVRTVESHLHRVMRKTGVERRHHLKKVIGSAGAGT